MPTYPDGATQVFSERTRFTALDVDGFPAVGTDVFVTDKLLKATFAPAKETGVDLVTINANGDIASHYKHGDMPKYFTMQIEVATPDPVLTAILAGGTVFVDNGDALGTPTGLALEAYTTGGTLANGTYGYRASQFNAYGQSAAEAEVTVAVTGPTGSVVVEAPTLAMGALGWRVFGRQSGVEQLLAQVPDIGSQATSAASGTGTVTTLTVTALTKPIPAGFTFQITGDTNTPKITFTLTETAGIGATSLAVSAPTITTTIAPAALRPVFVDDGSVTPNGKLPTSDTTAGPGDDVGYQAPPLAIVGNPDGVSIEFWGKAILNGDQTGYLPYWRWAVPRVKNLMIDSRVFGAELQSPMYMGESVENPNWGTGPFGDWQFDSSKAYQYVRAGRETLPPVGLVPVLATY